MVMHPYPYYPTIILLRHRLAHPGLWSRWHTEQQHLTERGRREGPRPGRRVYPSCWMALSLQRLGPTRVRTLNGELADIFTRWYPDLDMKAEEIPIAA